VIRHRSASTAKTGIGQPPPEPFAAIAASIVYLRSPRGVMDAACSRRLNLGPGLPVRAPADQGYPAAIAVITIGTNRQCITLDGDRAVPVARSGAGSGGTLTS